MSNAPYSPPPAEPPETRPAGNIPPHEAEPPYDEDLASTGVRKVLAAFEERDLQRIRWGAVLAGLFIAAGTQILLSLLGGAIGFTAVSVSGATPGGGFSAGAAIWMAVSSLIALFLGGYAAAKLSGSIRRSDGILAGLLTWATSLVLALWLVGMGAGAAIRGLGEGPLGTPGGMFGRLRPPAEMGEVQRGLRAGAEEAAGAAWGAFAGACVSLLAAVVGGAVGAVGTARERRIPPQDRYEAFRRERERDREDMAREAMRR